MAFLSSKYLLAGKCMKWIFLIFLLSRNGFTVPSIPEKHMGKEMPGMDYRPDPLHRPSISMEPNR
jgi:hypothetical protein